MKHNGNIIFTLMLLLFGALVSLVISPTNLVEAQVGQPTATPSDPVWLGFSTARAAIEEEEGIDLSTVRRWDFYQDDWSVPNANHPQRSAGIDSCVSTVGIAQGRPIYFGWTFVITSLRGTVHEARVSFNLREVAICDIVSTPSVGTPTPGGTPSANLPTAVPGSGATGAFQLGGHVSGLTPDAIAAMRRAGMTWVKKQLPTAAGIPEGVKYINSARENGFRILLGVIGDKNALAANPTAYAQQYASFVAELARNGADAIEVWNEPNIDREWPTGTVSGANYTALLAVAYNAIKSANPNTIVISGAPAPTGFFGAAGCAASGCNDDVFMQQMAAAGAANYLDCVGIHYNEGVLRPSANSGDPRGSYPTYFFGSMINRAAAPFPGKPICFTELGYLSAEGMGAPIPPNFDWTPADPVTVAEQAAWLAEAASIAAQRGNVRLMIVWNINFTRWDSDPMGGYAIIRPGGACPACDALGSVMIK
jgi:hypothetical protein